MRFCTLKTDILGTTENHIPDAQANRPESAENRTIKISNGYKGTTEIACESETCYENETFENLKRISGHNRGRYESVTCENQKCEDVVSAPYTQE